MNFCKLTTNYNMKLKIALAQNIYFLIYCVLVQKKLFQSTNWTTTYTNMSVITMFFHKPFQVALRRQLFLGHVMDQQFTLLLCMLNGTHMGPYKYCSYSEFHHVNWSQGWIHEFLERWWLVVHWGSLQTKQQAITCFSGYKLTTANLFETGLVAFLGGLSLTQQILTSSFYLSDSPLKEGRGDAAPLFII